MTSSARSTRRLRVLLTSTPGAGHLGPMLPLASALRSAGHDVLWATAQESCARITSLGFAAAAAGFGAGERAARLVPRMPQIMALDPRERRAHLFAGFFGDIAAPRMATDLTPVFEDFRPDVVIHEVAELAAAPMAVARGLPHVSVAFSGALQPHVIGAALAATAQLWVAEGAASADEAAMFGELYLHPFPAAFGAHPTHRNVRLMRPEASTGASVAVPDWLALLGTRRPLVYLTAGTEPSSALAPWQPAFEALAQLDVDVVATTGPALDPATFGEPPANVRVERFVPQALLLARAAVVASHAGAGTMLGAAALGVPQLLFPAVADQWDNADAIASTGAGIVCEPTARTADGLRAVLQRLLDDTSIRDAAAQVAAEIAEMPEAAQHVAAIEALVP